MSHFDKLFLAFTKLKERLRSKESQCIRYEYMKCDRNPAEKWGKPVTKKTTLKCRVEGQVFPQVPETIPANFLDSLICSNWELLHCFLYCLYKNIQPLLSSESTNSWSLLFQTVLRIESRSQADQKGKYLAPDSDATGPWLKAAGWFNP